MSRSATLQAFEQERRWDSLAYVFEKTDRILSNLDLQVEVVDDSLGAPSATDGQTVWFDRKQLGSPISPEALVAISGANYHELCHVLFTPRGNDLRVMDVRREGDFIAFNILEDMRIETMFVTRYPIAANYFTAMVVKFILENEPDWGRHLFLTYGRRYLDNTLRSEIDAKFFDPAMKAEVKQIIDDYLGVVFPKDWSRARKLIHRFQQLLDQATPDSGNGLDMNGHKLVLDKGKPESEEGQKAAQDAAQQQQEGDGDGEGQGKAGEGEGSDQEGEGGEGSGGQDSGEDRSADPNATEPDKGAGGGGKKGDIAQIGQQVLNSAFTHQDVVSDIAEKQRGVNAGRPTGVRNKGVKQKGKAIMVEDQYRTASRKMERELLRARGDYDPGWKRGKPTGRVDMIEARKQNPDRRAMFKQWDEGQDDAVDYEVVICMDQSTSMRGATGITGQACWALKKALDKVDASVTVMGFSVEDDVRILLSPEQRLGDKAYDHGVIGGTNPLAVVREAQRILYTSRRKHKVFVILTDGAFDPRVSATTDRAIKSIGAIASTLLFFYSGWRVLDQSQIDKHGAHHAESITDGMALVSGTRKVVNSLIGKR